MVATLHADFNHRNQSSVVHPVASVYIGSHLPQSGELIVHKTLIFVLLGPSLHLKHSF